MALQHQVQLICGIVFWKNGGKLKIRHVFISLIAYPIELRLLSMLKEELQDSDITSYKIGTIELSVKSSKESIELVSLLKTRNKVVEVG
jgi:hypothetical protein